MMAMYDADFIKQFAKGCGVCYKNGAIDIAVCRDETALLRLKDDTRYPNMYGTIKNSKQDWNEWRFNILSMMKVKNDFTAALIDIRSNQSVESVMLRVLQQFYNHGVEDYIVCGMPLNAASIRSLTSKFELRKDGYKRLSTDSIVQKIQEYTYERMAFDREFIEDYCGNDKEKGRKSHALGKKTYDRFSRMIWLATRKEEWYV